MPQRETLSVQTSDESEASAPPPWSTNSTAVDMETIAHRRHLNTQRPLALTQLDYVRADGTIDRQPAYVEFPLADGTVEHLTMDELRALQVAFAHLIALHDGVDG